jgi:hypothetical protein
VTAAVEKVVRTGTDAAAGEGNVTEGAADLVATLEPTLPAPASTLKEALTPLEALNPNRLSEVGSLASTNAWAGRSAPAAAPGGLLPDQMTRLPERRLPGAVQADPPPQGPIAIGIDASPLTPSALGRVSVVHRVNASGPLFSPSLPATTDVDQAPAVRAAWAGGPTAPFAPERSPSAHSQAGSGVGGSSFIPLLGVLALLALAAPRGYRRCMAVRDLPVPTPFACALDRPG